MRVPSTDGVELEVHDLGGDGPDLLLAHATGLHGRVWEPFASQLDGFHRWSIDFRAHGDSDPPLTRPLEWEGFADDVLATIDAVGMTRPVGVGHSMGAAALLMAEARRPGTFRALWCFEPAVIPGDAPGAPHMDNPMSQGALRRRPTFASPHDAVATFAAKPPFSGVPAETLERYVEHGFAPTADGAITLKCTPAAEAEVFAYGPASSAFAALATVGCPVTIGVGDEATMPAAFCRDITAALADGRLEQFDGLTHFGPLEDHGRLSRSVRQAFADLGDEHHPFRTAPR